MQQISLRLWCLALVLVAIVCSGVGCKKAAKSVVETSGKPPAQNEAEALKAPPSCKYVVDGDGNLIVDMTDCHALAADSSFVLLQRTKLGRPVILSHDTGQLFYALDSRCTKDGCELRADSVTLFCPCDHSRFSLSGRVLDGPATAPLHEFPSLKNGDRIRITLR
jgi:Rieske Fe-S protein